MLSWKERIEVLETYRTFINNINLDNIKYYSFLINENEAKIAVIVPVFNEELLIKKL